MKCFGMMMPISCAVFLSCFVFASGLQSLARGIFGQALMGDWISSLPSRFHCLGATNGNFTNFLLFSRVHPSQQRPLVTFNRDLLHKSDFDPTLPTKIIIHGFIDNVYISDWMQRMKDAFLAEGDYNVMIMDWSCGNEFPYFQAVQRSKRASDELKNLMTFLMDSTGAKPENFHLIGHSLGAHIAGRVGHAVPNVGRISGLDPAGPGFFDVSLAERLDPSDATFVDVIHTDAGHGLLEGLGMRSAIGHVDFYPNGGSSQPGCHESPFTILPKIGLHRAGRYYITCDHFRGMEFYIESIKPLLQPRNFDDPTCTPIGVTCRDWETYQQGRCADCTHPGDCAVMGYHSDMFYENHPASSKKELYLKTAEENPFCLFQYQVIIETACEHGSCDDDRHPGFNPGAFHLEMRQRNSKITRLTLSEDTGYSLKPGSQYVYLATSRFPLGQIEGAKVWWGSSARPEAAAGPALYSSSALKLRSLQINPISKPSDVNRFSQPDTTVLCAPSNMTIGRNQYLELSDC